MANDPLFLAESASVGESSSELALVPGILLGNKYRLLRPAGFGGMGTVWVARNEATAAEVAVKVLVTARQGVDQEAIARFRREAHTAAQLYHRGIVRIFDLVELTFASAAWRSPLAEEPLEIDSAVRQGGWVEPTPAPPDALVLVMELLRGETLASQMDRKRRFSQEETLAIAVPLLSALAHAHAQGIVHRDLKPENVFLSVDPDGHVIPKILDFGISKLLQPAAPRITTDGAMLGTPSYMSPEQARGLSNVDARADVFAVGILLYECLSGENPFASGSYHSVVAAILEREPQELSSVSPEVWRVIKRALEKPAALRYAEAGELASALTSAAQRAGVQTPDSSGAYPARTSFGDRSVPPAPFREPEHTMPSMRVTARRRTRARAAIGAIGALALLAVGGAFYARTIRPSAPIPVIRASPVSHAALVAPSAGAAAVPAEVSPPSGASSTPAVPSAALERPQAVPITTGPPAAEGAPAPAVLHARTVSHPPAAHAKPAPSVPPAPTASAAPRSTVVRDPGF